MIHIKIKNLHQEIAFCILKDKLINCVSEIMTYHDTVHCMHLKRLHLSSFQGGADLSCSNIVVTIWSYTDKH